MREIDLVSIYALFMYTSMYLDLFICYFITSKNYLNISSIIET